MFKLRLKKKESKKKKKAAPPGGLRRFVLGTVIPASASGMLVLFVLVVLVLTVATSGYFTLKTVETEGGEALPSFKSTIAELFASWQGRSIVTLNIEAIARTIASRYPDAKDVIVRRMFPDRLSVSIRLRKPAALVGNDKYYPVDRDGVIFPHADPSQWQKLPVIVGVHIKESDKVGTRCESASLQIALKLIAEMERSKISSDYIVTTIDVSDPKNVSFFLEDGVEVKIGHENFKGRLESLAQTLKNPRLIMSRIKYLDLRFKDIVIGQK